MLTRQDLINDLSKMKICKGDLLLVKVSIRSIGEIEGGAITLVDALLDVVGNQGTIVTASFVNTYPLPIDLNEEDKIVSQNTPSYAGALANAMVKHPKAFRSTHPVQKFVAIGRDAERLMSSHTEASYAYAVVEEMTKIGARNLKIGEKVIGVGTTHVVIKDLGCEKNIPNIGVLYYDQSGAIKQFKVDWAGGCGNGFPKFIPLYKENKAVISEGYVGSAECLYTSMLGTYKVEYEKLKSDPNFFFCDDTTCGSCRLRWAHSDKKYLLYLFHLLKKKLGKK